MQFLQFYVRKIKHIFLTPANEESNYFTSGKVYRACCAIKPSIAVFSALEVNIKEYLAWIPSYFCLKK